MKLENERKEVKWENIEHDSILWNVGEAIPNNSEVHE